MFRSKQQFIKFRHVTSLSEYGYSSGKCFSRSNDFSDKPNLNLPSHIASLRSQSGKVAIEDLIVAKTPS